ncbi:MAG: hypothetical protein LBE55_06515 [Clostridiales bacterium]|nr:hypothetical protein [Clostridiales bacterium]
MAKQILRGIPKHLLKSAIIFVIVAALALLFALGIRGYFTTTYIFTANFIVGGIILAAGLFSLISPMDTSRHTGGAWDGGKRSLSIEAHEKAKKSHQKEEPKIAKFICIGGGVLIITVIAQYLSGLIWQ